MWCINDTRMLALYNAEIFDYKAIAERVFSKFSTGIDFRSGVSSCTERVKQYRFDLYGAVINVITSCHERCTIPTINNTLIVHALILFLYPRTSYRPVSTNTLIMFPINSTLYQNSMEQSLGHPIKRS